ncbi:DNA-binding response regulator [Desertihabitans brevis]|uniref:DNA-binding response regulator n=1 Tax=Desertihabitans brevis TaxID=2268447 RepID=A0A367YW52_9ACTN|nr:response regulator transcription factor [Desertihabitans brevis]RCK70040.1 DNA-binding response regulator [Desertihabitans brevis]
MRALVAEDHTLLREGLIQLLELNGITVTAAVADEPHLRQALRRDDFDIAVLDVRLPPTGTDEGLRAALEIRAERPGLPVLVLSQYVEQLYARELLASAGSGVGYLLKDRVNRVADFVDAVRRVAAGGTVMDPEVVSRLLGRREDVLATLTPRERETLQLMASGRSNAAIAAQMVVTESAVGKNVAAVFAKLGLEVSGDDHRRVLAVLTYLQQS